MDRWMKWTSGALLIALVIGLALCACGCGNVNLQGQALDTAKESAMDAYSFWQRMGDANATDSARSGLAAAYSQENYLQWRAFVQSAVKDPNWGPKLPGEK